jgi:hypothetical protein
MHQEATDIQYRDSPLFWRFNCERPFLGSSFLMDDMLREHNERFFFLTAQNQRICRDVWTSCIMFRLGQHEQWNYIGMPTVFFYAACMPPFHGYASKVPLLVELYSVQIVHLYSISWTHRGSIHIDVAPSVQVICDAMCKIRMRPSGYNSNATEVQEGIVLTVKRPSAGLDLIREYLDTMRASYQHYIVGLVRTGDDGQLLVQLKRTTEGGLQTGYVLVVDGKIERMPENELAMDCMLPEVLTLTLHLT